MKWFNILISLCLVFVSCNSNTKNENTNSDSVVNTEDKTQKEVAIGENSPFISTFDETTDSNAGKEALKGLEFGITEAQFNKIEKKFLANFEDDEVYGYHIGDFTFHDVTPYYNEGKLYRLDVNGFNHLNMEEIISESKAIKSILSSKYGNPIFECEIPHDKELAENSGKCIAEWKIGKKTIQLCFFDFTKAAHSNLLKLVIFRSDVVNEIQNKESERQEKYSNANTDMI